VADGGVVDHDVVFALTVELDDVLELARHILAEDDLVGGAFGRSADLREHAVTVLGCEVRSIVGQDRALVPIPGALALDRDGSLGLRVGGQDIEAAGVFA